MEGKVEVAVDLLARIGEDRIRVANAEVATIPAALRVGLSAERIAHLTGATVERVQELEREVTGGKR